LGQTAQLLVASDPKPGQTLGQKTAAAASNNKLPPTTTEQKKVLKRIDSSKIRRFLLHGVTGSGKTRVYIELAKKCLDKKKSAIILTPEISLTPQLVKSFLEVFPGKVLLTHSGLSTKQRSAIWRRSLLEKGPWVVLGPRSAIFSPLGDLGLIVMDEAHDSAYKQDSTPYYQTSRVAGFLAGETGSTLVTGSATPGVNEYFLARAKKIPVLKMTEKAIRPTEQTETKVVDVTNANNRGRFPLISQPLVEELSKALENGSQAMVYINKRGDSKSIVCQNCGWQAKCPNCDLPLTFHSDNSRFSCHTCGRHYPARTSCQSCGSTDIIFKNPGTKAVAGYLSKLFPSARIARFDTDNKKAERIDARHAEVAKGDIDILVGTQLLTKGHDLPKLGLAAMLVAESGLNFPDYTAEERTYQAIRQLSGRVGRGHRGGKVIIQSFNPKNPLLAQAIGGDYLDFYDSQIQERKAYGFPPFYHVVKISSPRASSASSLKSAHKTKKDISEKHTGCIVLGPSPAFYFKKSGHYNWQLIIKSKDRGTLTDIISQLPSNHSANIDPTNLL
jgi:primosomal protein N' (replication factor Y)